MKRISYLVAAPALFALSLFGFPRRWRNARGSPPGSTPAAILAGWARRWAGST